MKKTVVLCVAVIMIWGLLGCQGKKGAGGDQKASAYKDSLEVLNDVVASYEKDDLFAMYGGDQEQAVMDAPGKFDIAKTEEMEMNLGVPKDWLSNIEDAASMVHMMNANTFTGAAYRLKDGADMDGFADAVAASLKEKQWVCGQPDTVIVIQVDASYVITAFGEGEMMERFKNNALSALSGAKVMLEESLA